MKEYSKLIVQVNYPVVRLTLNRPEQLNALDLVLKEELGNAIESAVSDKRVSVIVLSGAGKSFCAGSDLKDMSPEQGLGYRDYLSGLHKTLIWRMWTSDKIFISEVKGFAVGAGLGLVLASDIVVAAEDAKFQAPFLRGPGLVPDMGTAYLLPRVVGMQRAKRLLLTGERISAETAQGIGIVTKIASSGTLQQEVAELVKPLIEAAPMALSLTKKLINDGIDSDFGTVLEQEASLQALIRLTEDHQEGLNAFRERRHPHFRGR